MAARSVTRVTEKSGSLRRNSLFLMFVLSFYGILFGKTEGMKPLERNGGGWQDFTKTDP